MVRARAPAAAVAGDARPVRAAGERGDAPADAGPAGRAVLRALARALSRPPAFWPSAPARDVLSLWSGLGYNRRALALQRAAAVVAASGWPDDLTALPGVGPYTAAAVGLVRVGPAGGGGRHQRAARARAARRRGAHARASWRCARRRLLPSGRAATFNQAMMELGATVCRPRTPDCGACPVASGCHGPLPAKPRRRGGACASRTPTAGRVAGCSPRCSPGKSRRCRANGASARSPGSNATASSCAASDGSFRLP